MLRSNTRGGIHINKIYFGDNLYVMRKYISDNTVDLIYLDPPFNSNRAYNIIYDKEKAQMKAFDDTWTWSKEIAKTYEDIIRCKNEKIINAIATLRNLLGENNLMAYLTMMTVRLIEMHRILKPTGSIYLHCDPTASHYLKVIMDNIFGISNFQNEVIWHYGLGGSSPKRWQRKHDILLFYSKQENFYFKPLMVNATSNMLKGKKKKEDDVWDIPTINNMAKERTGYPTQKPLRLLDRVIKASSKKGDLVLDPFCGCATTLIAAKRLKRRWIGIDITYQSVRLLKERLRKNGVFSENFTVEGEPTTITDVHNLIKERGRFRFQDWIVGKINAVPNTRKTGDRGEDGFYFWNEEKKTCKATISVKSGKISPGDIRDLKGTIKRNRSEAGIFITLKKPTKGMIDEANSSGFIYDLFKIRYPKIQILTVSDILRGEKPKLPRNE